MAEATAPSFIFIIFCFSVATARKILYSVNDQDGSSELLSSANDGICASMVKPQGYVCEEHKVTTEDGYILNMQRIPSARSGRPANKPPVLLQHGLFSDGATWLFNTPDESLGFMLADNGFDVWISNTRGTRFSQGHISLTPNDPAYWEWSWDELSAYDLPATFQCAHGQTGQKLHYGTLMALAAFSQEKLLNMLRSAALLCPMTYLNQIPLPIMKFASDAFLAEGTLMALAAFSQEKLLNMLSSAALLCPIAYLNQIPLPIMKFASDAFLAEEVYWLGFHEFIPGGEAAAKLLEDVCNNTGIDCSNLLVTLTGPNCCVNSSRINIFLDNYPQATATKNMIHLAQRLVRTGSIAKYDYGNKKDNMNHYGQPTPPAYEMTRIPKELPLFLGYGGKDTLADMKDVKVLLENLKDHDSDKLVLQYVEEYAHIDFVFGVNANKRIYHPLMAFFNLN